MFALGDFWLETRIITKISTHPCYLNYFLWFFCFIPMNFSQSILGSKDGSKFWCLHWFPAKNHPGQTFLSWVYKWPNSIYQCSNYLGPWYLIFIWTNDSSIYFQFFFLMKSQKMNMVSLVLRIVSFVRFLEESRTP